MTVSADAPPADTSSPTVFAAGADHASATSSAAAAAAASCCALTAAGIRRCCGMMSLMVLPSSLQTGAKALLMFTGMEPWLSLMGWLPLGQAAVPTGRCWAMPGPNRARMAAVWWTKALPLAPARLRCIACAWQSFCAIRCPALNAGLLLGSSSVPADGMVKTAC